MTTKGMEGTKHSNKGLSLSGVLTSRSVGGGCEGIKKNKALAGQNHGLKVNLNEYENKIQSKLS